MLSDAIGLQVAPAATRANSPSEWYAVYTRHQHEKVVARILVDKGFEVFLPLSWTVNQWKDRKQQLWLPLFPCYVFLKQSLERRIEVLTTPGIHAFVSCGGQPAAIPSTEIDAIQRAVETGAHLQRHSFLRCGEWVRVLRGPLAGIQGILQRQKNVWRLILSVDILGQSAAVEVDACAVARVTEQKTTRSDIRSHV
jgi:transcription antitermination factor NusG